MTRERDSCLTIAGSLWQSHLHLWSHSLTSLSDRLLSLCVCFVSSDSDRISDRRLSLVHHTHVLLRLCMATQSLWFTLPSGCSSPFYFLLMLLVMLFLFSQDMINALFGSFASQSCFTACFYLLCPSLSVCFTYFILMMTPCHALWQWRWQKRGDEKRVITRFSLWFECLRKKDMLSTSLRDSRLFPCQDFPVKNKPNEKQDKTLQLCLCQLLNSCFGVSLQILLSVWQMLLFLVLTLTVIVSRVRVLCRSVYMFSSRVHFRHERGYANPMDFFLFLLWHSLKREPRNHL